MRIGLLADSHDRVPAVKELARRMAEAGVAMILHAGDYCSPFTLTALRECGLPLGGVFGRNDGDHEALRATAAQGMGQELWESPHAIEIGGRKILLVHDIVEVDERRMAGYEIVVHGMLHRTEIKVRDDVVMVCPGESCGWLHGTPTGAILDLDSREVEFIQLTGPEWQ